MPRRSRSDGPDFGRRSSGPVSKRSLRKYVPFFSVLMFPLLLFYYELVFKFSTTIRPHAFNMVYILLFSFSAGMILNLLTTIFSRQVNRIIKAVLIFASALPFLIEYFVYKQFKVFYDLNTVTAGAGDAVGQFQADIFRLIFSVGGLTRIFLFLLPGVLYLIFGLKYDLAVRFKAPQRIASAAAWAVLALLTILLIMISSTYRGSYNKEYNFQNAVDNFGLLTGVRLEIKHAVFGRDTSFEETDINSLKPSDKAKESEAASGSGDAQESESAAPTETEPVITGDNVLDIDFEKLASKAKGTTKELDEYVASLEPTNKNQYTGLFKDKNLILITAEAFSGDIIDETLTPTLYRLANKGINFTDYYLPATAGTTGGEYEHIFGMLPTEGGSSLKMTQKYNNYMTMGNQLNRLGYYGKAYHNNTYTYYDRDKTHINLGYSDGYMGYGNGMEKYVTKKWPESDLEMFQGTIPEYIDKEKFNIYYMTVSGHSGYAPGSNAMATKNMDRVADLDYSDDVKGYIACNLELEDALTYMVKALEDKGIADDTVIVLTGDHFPYGLDNDAALGKMPLLSELYGYNVENYLQRDHNDLIIWSGCLEKMDPITVDTPVSTIDILPTLSNLFGLEWDSRLLPGRDVFSDALPLYYNLNYDFKTELGTYINSTKTFTPVSKDVDIPENYVDSIKKIIRNRINYMSGVLETDYFSHVFGKK